jgi:hypothetical protein
MRSRTPIGVVLAMVLSACDASSAETSRPDAAKSPWPAETISCKRALAEASKLNAPGLFRSAEACAREERHEDSAFLLNAGQIRAFTDGALLKPASDADKLAMGELSGAIYGRYGGPGHEDIYRDKEKAEHLFARIEQWQPSFYEGYNPGWAYKPGSRTSLYATVAGEQARGRLAQLRSYVVLATDPNYALAQKELTAIQQRHPGGIESGTADHKRSEELVATMVRIAGRAQAGIAEVVGPSVLEQFEPEPSESFTQVYVGFDGRSEAGEDIFQSADDARRSWLVRAMPEAELDMLLSRIDFDEYVLVSLSFGKVQTATGRAYMEDATHSTQFNKWSISGRFGVNVQGCSQPHSDSYPFVLATAKRPPSGADTTGGGYFLRNFQDGCKPPMSGKPAN